MTETGQQQDVNLKRAVVGQKIKIPIVSHDVINFLCLPVG
jgi:hypothetical protein